MRRRDVITGIGTALAWPMGVRAQQQTMPVVGFLNSASPGPFAHLVAGFRKGLGEEGFVEGRNVAVEYRWAEGQYDRLPALAADLVRRPVAVLAAAGGGESVGKALTTTIPIVFVSGADPVEEGLVTSLSRPTGNITGVTQLTIELAEKRLGLLHEVVSRATTVAVLVNPDFRPAERQVRDVETAGAKIGLSIVVLRASSESEFDPAFRTLVERRAGALLVGPDPFFNSRRERIVALAAEHRIPTIYEFRQFAEAGGLMSYGTDLVDAYRQVGVYVGRILKGAKPADLPVVQSAKFELVVNLKTAKALGLTILPALLLRADEVIE